MTFGSDDRLFALLIENDPIVSIALDSHADSIGSTVDCDGSTGVIENWLFENQTRMGGP